MKLRIALSQSNIAFGKVDQNINIISRDTVISAQKGNDLVLFPELMSTGYDLENASIHADAIDEGTFAFISQLAKKNRIAIGGTLLEKENNRIYNTFVLYNSAGVRIAKYRKIHLFGPMNENKWLCAGSEIVVTQTLWAPVGLATCYDLRFPELFRALVLQQAKLVLVSAEWPIQRIDHWRTLLRARAIENQFFIAATNRVGSSPNDVFGGFSAVISPWGETMIETGANESLTHTLIDFDQVDAVRQQIPVLKDRRPDVYC